MKNILVVSGHTDLKHSVANKTILAELAKKVPNIEIDELDSLYPDFKIDVAAEQQKLVKADIIVLQYPMFWFSFPSILERWMEESFTHGFSHGTTGDKLKGKKLVLSFTMGAPVDLYHKDGAMGFELEDFLPCVKATCAMTGMKYCGYVCTGGVSYQMRSDEALVAQMKQKAADHADRLITLLEKLEN